MTALNTANLGSLGIPVPGYDRSTVSVGIVHFGVGGFHRAHQAMYLDQLMEQGQALDWGICGVGVMPFDLAMKQALEAQDCLFTMVLKDRGRRLGAPGRRIDRGLPVRPGRSGCGDRADGPAQRPRSSP